MVIIEESEMKFGEYPDEDVFRIEKSHQYTDMLMEKGVKTCEFILKRGDAFLFIEAKKRSPMQITADSPADKVEKYNEYITGILLKMRHSLLLYANILLKRYDCVGVPEGFLEPNLETKKLKLLLVVKEAEDEWLIPLQEKLNSEFIPELRLWNIDQILVINEARARRKSIII